MTLKAVFSFVVDRILRREYEAPETRPWDFAPPPRLNARDDSWDPTPGIEHDLDGNPVPAVEENPWGDGRT